MILLRDSKIQKINLQTEDNFARSKTQRSRPPKKFLYFFVWDINLYSLAPIPCQKRAVHARQTAYMPAGERRDGAQSHDGKEMTYLPFQSEGRSKRRGIVRVDRRTREGKLLEQTRAALTLHVGGNPTFVECAAIERAAFLTVEVAKVNARIAAGTSTAADLRAYLSLSNALSRATKSLGVKSEPAEPRRRRATLAQVLAGNGAS
jgi:hypothetical protein